MTKQTAIEETSEIEKKIFEERENSENYWFNKSSDLYASAGVLWMGLQDKEELKTELGFSKGFSLSIACYPTYQLLIGLSIELLLKAIIVAKKKKPKPIHDLVKLSLQAEIKLSDEENKIFQLLSEVIAWEGKYPVPDPKMKSRLFNQWNLWKTIFHRKQPDSPKTQTHSIEESLEWTNIKAIWKRLTTILFEIKEKKTSA